MDELAHDEMTTLTLRYACAELVTIRLDSCSCTWYFRPARFRRILKGPSFDGVSTGWRRYYGLRFDDNSDGFVVLLNPEGTRLLRSWRHQYGSEVCGNCAPHGLEPASHAGTSQSEELSTPWPLELTP